MMRTISRVLFPVVFSAQCEAMSRYVTRIAELFYAQVTILHVVDPTDLNILEDLSLYIRSLDELRQEHFQIQKDRLEAFLANELPKESVQRVLLTGDPADEIARYASSNNFDLIVMPTYAGRFRRTLLGSTAAKVLDSAACLVLLAAHSAEIKPRELVHRKWLCAMPVAAQPEALLETTASLAKQVGAEVSVLSILDSRAHGEEGLLHITEIDAAKGRITEMLRAVEMASAIEVREGELISEVLAQATAIDADVLITARETATGTEGRLSSTVYSIVRRAPCPVLVV